jgi:hypothetical protein
MPIPLPLPHRAPGLRPAVAGILLAGVAASLSGCEQVAIIRSAPSVAASFDQKHGNDPLAAGDAASLEAALQERGQAWTIRFDTQPASAGEVQPGNQQSVLAGRGRTTSLAVTLSASAQAMRSAFSARGKQGEEAYLVQLVQIIANAGYTRLTAIRVDVWFSGTHHGTLTWSARTSFVYTVLDNTP